MGGAASIEIIVFVHHRVADCSEIVGSLRGEEPAVHPAQDLHAVIPNAPVKQVGKEIAHRPTANEREESVELEDDPTRDGRNRRGGHGLPVEVLRERYIAEEGCSSRSYF